MVVDRRGFLWGILAVTVGGPRLLFTTETRTGMYGLIGSMEVVPGRRDELVSILLEGTRSMPGCLSYVVAVDPTDAVTVWVTEVWESQESHEASLSLPAVQRAIAHGRPLITGSGNRTVTIPAGGHGLHTGGAVARGSRRAPPKVVRASIFRHGRHVPT